MRLKSNIFLKSFFFRSKYRFILEKKTGFYEKFSSQEKVANLLQNAYKRIVFLKAFFPIDTWGLLKKSNSEKTCNFAVKFFKSKMYFEQS